MLRENKLSGILYLIRHCFFSSASLHSFVFPCCCCYLVAKSCLTLCNPMNCIAHQAPLSMGFPGQEYRSGLPFPLPGDLPHPGIKTVSPALAGGFFTNEPYGNTLGTVLNGFFFFFFKYLFILDLAALGLCCHIGIFSCGMCQLKKMHNVRVAS